MVRDTSELNVDNAPHSAPDCKSFWMIIFSKTFPIYGRGLIGLCSFSIVESLLLLEIKTHLAVFLIWGKWLSWSDFWKSVLIGRGLILYAALIN